MKRKLITSIFAFTTLLCVYAYGIEFSHSATVENNGSKKYKAIRLSSEVYNNSREDLADLMIYNKNNESTAYFINSFTDSSNEQQKTYAMKQVNSFVMNGATYFDFSLVSPLNEDVTATSMELEADQTEFVKKIQIWGGYDNVKWEKVQNDILYDVGGSSKLEIQFSSIKKYTYYRLELANNVEKVSFKSANLKYNKIFHNREYFVNTLIPSYSIEQRNKMTAIKLQGLKNLKVTSVTIQTPDMFKRNVMFDGIPAKMLYSLEFKNTSYKDLTIPIDGYSIGSDNSEIVINNEDDKPIQITRVEVQYLTDELIFDGSQLGNYTLHFGNSEMNEAQSYDISNYREQILNEGYDILKIKNIKELNVKPAEKPQQDYTLIFNITIMCVAAIMAMILIRKLKK